MYLNVCPAAHSSNQSNTLYSRIVPMPTSLVHVWEIQLQLYSVHWLEGAIFCCKIKFTTKASALNRIQFLTPVPEVFFFHRVSLGPMWITFRIGREEERGREGREGERKRREEWREERKKRNEYFSRLLHWLILLYFQISDLYLLYFWWEHHPFLNQLIC